MNKLNGVQVGGFPVKMDDFAWMANGIIEAIKGLMSTYGIADDIIIILSGCKKTEASGIVTIAEGYVSRGGEIMYVPEHSFTAPTLVQKIYWTLDTSYDAAGLKTFQDSTTHDTYEVRIAKCHAIIINPLFQTYGSTDTIYDIVNRNIDGFPIGGICMWSGDPSALPTGWSLCDGTSGTPDLRGRFVVGYDDRDADPLNDIWDINYNVVGNDGGEKKHQLAVNELPTHTHKIDEVDVQSGTGATVLSAGTGAAATGNVDNVSLNRSHENRPPYFVLAYIMKTATQVNSTLPGYL